MSSNELYDEVAGINFDALAERTGFPVEKLRAFDRECAEDGIRTLMSQVDALATELAEAHEQIAAWQGEAADHEAAINSLTVELMETKARGDRLQSALVAQGWYAQALHRLVIAALGHLSEEAIRRRADADETAELCRQHGDIRFLGDVTERPEHTPEAHNSPESDERGA